MGSAHQRGLVVKRAIYALAFIHLGLMAASITHGLDDIRVGGWLERPLGFIRDLNYSVWRYGFFAPDVGVSTEVEIRIHEEGGKERVLSTVRGFRWHLSTQDSANRFYGFKRKTPLGDDFLNLAAHSVATRLFNRYPEARRVDYTMRTIRYPTLEGYRKGEEPKVHEFYDSSFVLR